jgi:hypothetical protein
MHSIRDDEPRQIERHHALSDLQFGNAEGEHIEFGDAEGEHVMFGNAKGEHLYDE